MTWAAFLTASGLTIAACAALFVAEWLAARTEHRRREGDDWMAVANAVQQPRRLRLVR